MVVLIVPDYFVKYTIGLVYNSCKSILHIKMIGERIELSDATFFHWKNLKMHTLFLKYQVL